MLDGEYYTYQKNGEMAVLYKDGVPATSMPIVNIEVITLALDVIQMIVGLVWVKLPKYMERSGTFYGLSTRWIRRSDRTECIAGYVDMNGNWLISAFSTKNSRRALRELKEVMEDHGILD